MGFSHQDINILFDPGSQISFWGEASPVHRGERVLNPPVQGMQPGAAIGILTWLHLAILVLGSLSFSNPGIRKSFPVSGQ